MKQEELTKTFMMVFQIEKTLFGLDGLRNIFQRFDPLTAKLFNLNFHPPEVVSRWRDSQL